MWDIKKSDKFKVTMNGNREVEVDTIDIVVTSNETGNKMSAAIVNKHLNEDRNIILSVDGLCGGKYKIISVNGPKADSYNDVGKTEIKKVKAIGNG